MVVVSKRLVKVEKRKRWMKSRQRRLPGGEGVALVKLILVLVKGQKVKYLMVKQFQSLLISLCH